jgi:O-antigen ligase
MDPVSALVVAAIGLMALIWVCSREPWILLVTFWLISITKQLVSQWFPWTETVDPTAVAAVLTGAVVVTRLVNSGLTLTHWEQTALVWHLLLGMFMLASVGWTTAPAYGFSKALRYLLLSTVSLVGSMAIAQDDRALRRMEIGLVAIALFTAAVVIFFPSLENGKISLDRVTAFEGSPLNGAFVMATGAVLSWCRLFGRGFRYGAVALSITAALLVGISYTGSRAMFLQVLVGVAVWCLTTRQYSSGSKALLGLLAGLGAILVWQEMCRSEHGTRLGYLDGQDESSTARLELWGFCFREFYDDFPLVGHGAGAFAMNSEGIDQRFFPHNLILEAMYETGLVGAAFLLLFFTSFIASYFAWSHRAGARSVSEELSPRIWFPAAMSALLCVMVHWDLADVRLTWMLIGASLGACRTAGVNRSGGLATSGPPVGTVRAETFTMRTARCRTPA